MTDSLERVLPMEAELDGAPSSLLAPSSPLEALSHGQRALWFLHHLAPVEGAYNIAAAARVRTPIGGGALECAFQSLVDRHAALRTTFPAVAGEPCRQVAASPGFALTREDATGWSEERLRRRLAEEAWRPFDLERGPLLRATLWTGGSGGPVLLFVIHHIVADFWSLAILMRELPALYREAAGAELAELPPPGLSYEEHVRLEREALAGRGEALLAWWRERLADLPTLELAADRPRPAVQTYRGDCTRLRLPGELAAALRARSRTQHGTLFMALVAAFQALLSRHTGQEDLTLGTPRAGRSRSSFAGTVGYFVNPVVLRGDLSGDPSFAELLERAKATVIAAFAHGDCPLPLLAEHLQPVRDASRAPLFQVSFALQKETRGAEGLTAFALGEEGVEVGTEGFRLESLAPPSPPSPFDLVLHAVDRQGGLSLALQYNTGLFDGTTAARFLEHFVRLLAGAAADPGRRLSELPLLSPAERAQLLVEWNDTATATAPETLPPVHELVLEQARRRPEALAVAAPEERLTYGELAARAGQLAAFLQRHGVRPEVRVALCAGQTVHRVVGSLAVLLAGGAYVPLDPEAPPERLAFLAADSEAAVVLAERALARSFRGGSAQLVELEGAADGATKDGPLPAPAVDPDHLAYVVYTSGSTGRPKGVAISHAGLLNLVRWHCARYGVGPGDRATLLANPAFDAAVWEIWPYLAAGASLHVPDPQVRLAPPEIVRFWRSAGITWSFLPTPLAEEVLAEEGVAGLALKGLLCGGDRLRQAPRPGLPISLINHYGPSEVSVVSTAAPVLAGTPWAPPIGRPIHNLRAHVVEARGGLAPRGAAGELWIGGVGLARGYLGRPDLTAERFVPDPWSREGGERLYRTGDLARHRPGGSLEFLGRIDQQIKLRGFRIEPGEIEAALREHPAVSEAAVALVGQPQRLVAYVVGVAGQAPAGRELRESLRARLPAYMVPATYVALPALPRTPHGKLDRRALPGPAPEEAGKDLAGPRTPVEELVAGIFAEVLEVGRIGIAENFFDLGGHSLLATQVASRVRNVFGVELPVRTVFEAPTVEGLAAWLDRSTRAAEPAAHIRRISRDRPLVLSFAQQRLWFLDRLEPGSPLYNIPVAAELTGRLDRAALAAALGEVVRRHEALRTTFAVAGEPVQVIAEPAGFVLPLVDLQGLAGDEEAGRLAAAEARRPFDLSRGRLVRATLLRSRAERHVLLLTMHHIVSDGWSMGVLVEELGALYRACLAGRPSPLPELALQYADFAVWQREHLAGGRLEAELAWWRERLAGMPAALELPADHPRSASGSRRGAVQELAVGRELLAGLTGLSRRHGATLFMTLLAGFAALLQRFTGQEDLAVGTPIAGRTRVETEPLIGLFVNTLALRTDLSGEPDLAELLARVREVTLSAYAHQELPFERLVEALAPERDLSRPPLVQVLLALQNAPPGPLGLSPMELVPGLALAATAVPTGTAKFELTCTLTETEGGFAGTLEYDRDLFDATTALRLADGFARLLAAAVAAPEARVAELPLLSPAEQAALLVEWNDVGTPPAPPEDTTLHGLFEARAARTPEAIALVDGRTGERWSYRDLDLWAGSLARRLADLGVGPEVRVAVRLPRTPLLVASLLAVLKSGGAYVALDPDYPEERLSFLLEDSAAAVLISEDGAQPLRPETTSGSESAHPENLAYLIYTSGSTGRPKGVAIEHRSAVAFARWAGTVFAPDDFAGVLAATSVSFDLSVFELFVTLAWGGTVILATNALELPRLQAAGEVTLLNTVPSAMAELVRQRAVPESVRTVNLAGEPLKRSLVDAIYESTSAFQVLDLYGPSEATTYSTWAPAPRGERHEPTIGRPIAGTRVVLFGRLGELVPVGVAGALYLGGAGLARGYFNRPDLTAERFVPDPFAPEPGGRLYHTGDLARRLPDGRLDYLGRIDQQVKVRGFRIELGEVEAALLAHGHIRAAAVLAVEGSLVACVAAEGEAPEPSALRGFLRERLPDFMVPSAWLVLPSLPLTPNGKVDRKALAQLRPERGLDAGTAPRTPAEELLAGIFAEVLDVERVGVEDSFFERGGHSLLAVRLLARAQEAFGVDLPLRQVFETPTVAALARAVEAAAPALPPLVPVPRDLPLPLSFAQQRLWFLHQLEPASPLYNVPVALHLRGRLDRAGLAAALREVGCRHEALRTRFVAEPAGPVQVVDPPAPVPVPEIDLASLPADRRLGEALRRAGEESRDPFDLCAGPLLRATLVCLGATEQVLLLTLHHIVCDGWSLRVLARELGEIYSAPPGRPAPLPDLAVQVGDHAAWQRQWLQGERLDAELEHWRARLADAPPVLDLPLDRPRPAVRSDRGGSCDFVLPPGVLASLRALAQREGVTLFMAALATFQALLARVCATEDVSVGTPVAGRGRSQIEGVVGCFVNTLVMRTGLAGDPPFRELLARVREVALAAYAHQDLPFEKLVEELQPHRDLSHTPLFQVSFALEYEPPPVPRLAGCAVDLWRLAPETEKFDLSLTLEVGAEGLSGELSFRTDLFDRATILRLAGCFERLLTTAVTAPAQRIASLPLLSEAERHGLRREWGAAPAGPRRGIGLDTLFATQVERAPDAVAVVCGGERLTYGELDRRVERCARHLRRRGAGPEVAVGVLLEPSPDLVVALLAVWRTGGVFLPLDPAYPAERLAFMREDSGTPLVVTRRELADWQRRADEGAAQGAAGPGPSRREDLAYIIYTSGSTGRPKGVAVSQGAAADYMETIVALWGLRREDRVLQLSSPSFDLWLEETVPALISGATLILRGEDLWEPARFLAAVRELGLTVVDLPTAYWHQWVREGVADIADDASEDLPLRLVVAGGEAMSAEAARLWCRSPLGGVRLLNSYGPTEAVVSATFHPVDASPTAAASVPLGSLLPGRTAYVLDRYGGLLPAGVPGELCLGGAALARGYLHRPDLTAGRFVPDPFSSPDGEGGRLYRTGDLARYLPGGRLDYLGRIDQQVKVRGFRIELGEIEAALVRHPGVGEAVVLARPAADGVSLAAYVVAAPGEAPEPSALRSFLRERLPDFMLPAAWMLLPALPLTVNGKVDRKALAALRPEPGVPAAKHPGVAPRTPTEELVAGIFAEVLGVERVGVADDFFALGGHSLLATQVASRVRTVLGVELPVRTVFEAPTVESLSGWIEQSARSGGTARLPAIEPVGRERPPALSFAQQRLWFLDQLEPGSPLYNMPAAVELTGRLDAAALAAALGEVVRRHEALRTAFPAVAGEPVQVVAEHAGPVLPLVDLQGLPELRRAEQAHRLAAEEARRPFALDRGPLLRQALLRSGAERHVLLLTMHHIVSDGWSVGVLVRELGALYGAFVAGRPSPLPELALQYADVAAWQRRHVSGELLESELAWWRERLADMPAALELPADHPRPAARSVRGAIRELAIERELLAGLAGLSRRHGTTLFMTLLAGFAGFLERVTGAQDLVVGTPIAGRTREEAEPLIGFFVNTLVLRVDLSGAPGFLDLLRRVRETALAAYAHQEVPFERLVEELAPERDGSRPPLVQVMLALQNAPEGPLALPGLELRAVPLSTGTAKLELTVAFTEAESGLAGMIEFSRDLFDETTVARWAGQLVRLLAAAVADPSRPVPDLPLLGAGERQQALVEWNDTRSVWPREACIHELFAAVAAALPDAPAIVAGTEIWSYRRLDEVSDRLARHLRSLGVGPQTPVCLSLERSPELIAGSLAVLKAGGVYIPLDPGYPDDRLAFMLADAGAQAVLVHGPTRERMATLAGALQLVDVASLGSLGSSGSFSSLAVPGDALAYVIYTSGSTGRPKGVAVPHRAVVRLVRETDYAVLGPGDRVGHAANSSFDAATWEIWGSLLNGAAVVVIPQETVLAPAALAALLREQRVTSLFLTTALFTRMAREVPDAFVGLRELLFGGEAVDPAAVRTVLAAGPPRRLLHVYGPTESTTFASWHPVREVAPRAATVPIGLPLANTSLWVLSRWLSPVPLGSVGELSIGGDGLAWGYWKRPELTAERFVPHPWEPGGRLYRTGDLVRRLPDGPIEFLGRLDHQVKIRGFRIEPGEIEAVLLEHPAVCEAAVVVLDGGPGERRLAAWVVGAEAGAPAAGELRRFLQERVPGYMVPSFLAALPALPLTPSGKVDRRALAALGVEPTEAGTPPLTPIEELLAGIFAEVLGVERVDLESDFFALGGHSLLATQVASRIQTVLGVELPLRVLFDAPTVRALAGWIERERAGRRDAGPGEAMRRVSREDSLPLSFAQQRLWFLDQLEPGSPLYNIPVAVELTGRLDVPALAAALGEVVRRHEALRTTFRSVAGEPVQVIAEHAGFVLPLIDLAGCEHETGRLTHAEASRPFDLGREPLLRAVLLQSGAGRHVLLLTMHHIVSDGWSMGVLVRELGSLYAAFVAGRPSPLPELAVQSADFAAWQRGHLAGERLEAELAWWRERLAGMPAVLDLPADHPRPAARSVRGADHEFTIGGEDLGGLAALARRHGATLFMTLIAGFSALLQRWTGADDLAMGSPIAGRTRVETEPLIGMFVNTLVLRADLSGAPDFLELLGRVREAALSAYAHQEVPFERLVEELVPKRDLSRPPLVQVVLNLQNAPAGPLELPGLTLAVSPVMTGTAKFELSCALTETDEGLAGALQYNIDLFEGPTIVRLAERFVRLLAGAAADPRRRMVELPLLSEAEQAQLAAWNATAVAAEPPWRGLHELFAIQAARRPEALAATDGERELTYGELDRLAGRLAGALRCAGARTESLVALCLERSVDQVVGVLAALAAGGAFVVLDPAQPARRLRRILEDASPAVVLAHAATNAVARAAWNGPVIRMDETGGAAAGGRVDRAVPTLPEQLAYAVYTSGSTGTPKGVLITHGSVVNLLTALDRAVYGEAGPDLRVSVNAPLYFDGAIKQLIQLLRGRTLCIVPEAVRLDPEALAAFLVRQRVDVFDCTPAQLRELVGSGWEDRRLPRRVLVGGEAVSQGLWDRLRAIEPADFFNVYGPSECTVDTSIEKIAAGVPRPGIGRPLANVQVHVLDAWGGAQPSGAPGELCVGGLGLARGYLGRPDLTAERFVPNPHAGDRGARLYRSGDLARWRPDGTLEFLGRIDHQVKVRGYRIELGEIEAALSTHPAVREAAVVLSDGHLVAYVVSEAPAEALRGFLRERLPGPMVPSFYPALSKLPLMPNGKVDRKALARLRPDRAESSGAAPGTPAEELVAGIFAAVLGAERVGTAEDFFALGGHSLLATQVVSRVRSVFGVELPVRAVFETPTVAGLAARIAATDGQDRPAEIPPPARAERVGPLPLSFSQERLWFLEQLAPGSATYNMPVQVELSGALHAGALSAALTEVVRRHESLRTTFVAAGGVPQQRIAPAVAFPLPLVDLSTLPAPAGGDEAERLGREQAGMGFDLESGPLFVALLVRLDEQRHRFLLNVHHIVSDGWSSGVLVRELGTLYPACLEGRPSPLAELPIQYADFAVWQRGWLAGKQSAELAYWETRLGGEVAPVELPSDRPRPAIQTFRGGRRQLVLPPDLTARLASFGRAEGATLFMTLLAATQALLSRHSGEHDVPVGAPVAGRRWSETEGLIGFFLNTLVLRADLAGPPSFRELSARVRTVALEAYSHQDVPFEAVLSRLRLDRDLSRAPLFQVLFNMLNLPRLELSLPGLELRVLTPAEVPSKFDLTFYLAEGDGAVGIDLVYNADLFDEARMADLLAQLETFLAQAVERPDDPVDRLSLVTATARALLPDPTAPLDGSWIGGVHELFAAQAGRTPERPAVIGIDGVWSYGDLRAGSRGVAGWLAAHGVRPGDPVAILAHRSAPLVQAVLGVLTAGAAFTILDPAYPPLRQVEMLDLAAPRAWIALEAAGPVPGAVRSWLEAAGCPCLELPAGGRASLESLAPFAADPPWGAAGPDDVACIGFTSGSTGGPKGILGRHGPLSHFLPAHCREFELGPDDRFSLLSGLAHDPLQRDIFTPLSLGAAIVVPDPADFGIAGRWAEWMRRERVTVAHLTPALGQLLTERPPGGEVVPVPSLRRVFLVGESLTLQDVARLRAMASGVTCINLYGSTETQRAVGFHRVAPAEAEAAGERARQVLPLGCGVRDVQLLVINRAGGLAGIGEIGEIAVRSPHLARGYLGNDELTAERFQVNPFTGESGDRIYRTGDLGRYLPNGEVAFAGRADFQVKLRGFRIELGEIEAVLTGHPAVREAVVLLRTDLPGGAGLAAYVVAEGREEERTVPLRGWLEERLPGYMVPAAFVPLESLPRTPNGKVDRRALERIAPEMERAADAETAPRTPAEELLAGLWAQVLGIERAGAAQSFFELGGHSLLATQLVSRIRELFQVELELRAVFEAPTVAGLAERILARQRAGGRAELPPIQPAPRQGDLPLSFAQQRLWFLSQMDPAGTAFNMVQRVSLEGVLDAAGLEGALREVERRHEVLRTRFVVRREEPCQVIDPPRSWSLPRVDLSGLEAGAAEREQRRLSAAEAAAPFDLARGPLWRAVLLRLGAGEHVLLLTQHHIVSDGWSMRVLVREVAALYAARRAGRPSPLPALPVQYADFALWQRRWLQGEVLQAQLDYWTRQLGGMPPVLELPADRPRTARGNRGGLARHRFATPLRELRALSRRHNVTLFILLMAAFQVLLRWLVRRDDIVVGTDIANRDQLAIEGTIGFFVNQLAIRSDLSGDPTFGELLARVREVTLGAYAHQQLPFDKLVEVLQPERSSTQAPIFQVKCNLLNLPVESAEKLPDLVLRPLEKPPAPGQLDWLLNLSESGEDLLAALHYRADLFDAATVGHALALLDRLLAAAVASPESTLAELDGVLARAGGELRERQESAAEQVSFRTLQKAQRRLVRIS